MLSIPGWRPFEHDIHTDSTLFEMSDEPLARALGWLRMGD
jgi:gentisate 1,2-dioxygenase